MPAHVAHGKSKKAMRTAVAANMRELSKKTATPRPLKQRLAIAYSEARGKKKK